MRTHARMLAVAAVALVGMAVVTACDNDDDDSSAPGTPPAAGQTADVEPAPETTPVAGVTAGATAAAAAADPCTLRTGIGGSVLQQGPSASISVPSMRWQLCVGNAAAGSSEKMLFLSTDGGATWTLISRTPTLGDPPPEAGVGELANGNGVNVMLFLDVDIGWMGLGSPGQNLWRSQDGGVSWTPIPELPPAVPVTAIDFTDSLNGTAVTSSATWTTADGGDTWTEAP